jgi:hypothetical protein
LTWLKCDGLYLEQVNVDCFLAHRVLSVVAHNFKGEPYDESVLSILQKLLGQISLLHIIEMEEEVLVINVRQDESVTLSLIEELESACYPVFKVLHVWII